jgi:hypothetical protein
MIEFSFGVGENTQVRGLFGQEVRVGRGIAGAYPQQHYQAGAYGPVGAVSPYSAALNALY